LTGQLDQVIAAAGSINNTVQPINQSVLSIGSTVQSINSTVGSIAGTVNSIEGNASGILSTVNEIQPGIVTINNKADLIIADARTILSDLDNTLFQVSGTSQIAFHADSINNATCLLKILNLDVVGLLNCGV
ncbi:MAG: hypothetical protein LC708_01900, partial [Actinobacteria bacterium]|nr:hypothetical protein [Actinomycetota bacterium]